MNDPRDVTSFMVWLHEAGKYGDIYHIGVDRFLWKKAGVDTLIYLCEESNIKLIDVSKV